MLRLGIIGATGYVGAEIVRLLALRDDMKITTVVSNSFAGQPFSEVYPSFRGIYDEICDGMDIDKVADKADFFITALPHGVSTTVIPRLLEKGKRIIDHSGDFRFRDVKVYEEWYKVTHSSPELVSRAVYGLPELYRDKIKNADLVADPGCYPTCSILGIAPALANKLVSHKNIVISAASGVSGAGRKSDLPYAFCEVDENYKAYGVVNHRHTPEIEQELSLICGEEVIVSFTPHLVPMKRGMLATITLDLTDAEITADEVRKAYLDFYRNEPFVRILPSGQLPQTKLVSGSNYIDIGISVDKRAKKLIIISALDNLGKGSASQAIQALNIMAGFEETRGLLTPGLYL
ncbi:MAG TPA: N-acetyl-gamma-glutamyl-phosphate reductase [Clostridiaceae bacterium]|nr:N-acetyl-gamma-glutamyl-phosphate reductase [Clostridiaceae bacterium]